MGERGIIELKIKGRFTNSLRFQQKTVSHSVKTLANSWCQRINQNNTTLHKQQELLFPRLSDNIKRKATKT